MNIIITLPRDHANTGTFRLEDGEKNILLGPWPVACSEKTPLEFQSQLEFGHEVLASEANVTRIIPISGGNQSDIRELGRYGLVELVVSDLVHMEAVTQTNSLTSLYIHGGDTASDKLLPPSPGSFRLRPEHHRLLVTKLGEVGLPVRCTLKKSDNHAPTQPLAQQMSAVGPKIVTSTRVAALAAAAAVGAPFFLPATVQACTYDNGISFSSVDFTQLAAREGGTQVQGYVPDEQSGVNIAAGLDLGNVTSENLSEMGFGDSMISLLKPYLAVSPETPILGSAASKILAASPLLISSEMAQEMNTLFFAWNANLVGSQFNSEAAKQGRSGGKTFSTLPAVFQTAMTDLLLADKSFLQSKAFGLFSAGEWQLGITALTNYSSTRPTAVARAKVVAVSLSQSDAMKPFLNGGSSPA
jgi:Bacterial toxin homologue of phage lysozyme, C-term